VNASAPQPSGAVEDRSGGLDDFFENGNVGLHLVGKDGIILRANRADYEPLGYCADEYIGHHIAEFHADRPVLDDILARLSRGERLDKYPARLRARDGSVRHVQISSSVCFRDGEFVNTRCFTVDVSDRMAAEAALREAQARLAATYENVVAGIAEVDDRERFLRVNEAFCRISGYTREELLERGFTDLTHPDDLPEDRLDFTRQVAGEIDRYTAEKRYVRKDGQVRWIEVTSTTVADPQGDFAYGVRMVQDITDRVQADRRQKLLLNELNHRVKNTLATVQSLAAQTARTCESVQEFRTRFEPRLIALSKAHDRLTRNRWEGANLREIVAEELAPHQASGRRLDVTGPDLILTPRASLSLSMALHELATNAAKHGALSAEEGRLEIGWETQRTDSPFPTSVEIVWAESGGPPVSEPGSAGFGSRLLRVTAAELEGQMSMEFKPSGIVWTLCFPLPGAQKQDGQAEATL
jgi:PAS domain S-box-containing protein